MGYYIQTPDNLNKAYQLVELHGAKIIQCPARFADIPADQALVCVVQNGLFDAAGFAYSEREFEEFRAPDSGRQRPRTWLLMDRKLVVELTGFPEGS